MALSYKNDNDIDEQNNPANRLSASENDAAFDDIANNYDKTADPSQENDNIKKARDKEENFSSNVSSKNAGNKGKLNLKGFFKKNSKNGILPSSVVLISLITGIFGLGGLSLNSLMLVHIKENITSTFDTQNTSMELRTEKLWAKKMAGENTSKSCSVTKILCRYSKPSGRMLKQLKKNGILALDKDGKVVKHKKLWPDKRPVKYVFQDGMNGLKTVPASEFSKELKDNPKFRSKFRSAYNPRWMGFADSVAKRIFNKFRVTKSQGKLNAKDKKAARKSLAEGKGGREGAVGKNAKASAADKIITENIEKLGKSVKAAGKGGATTMLAGVTCIALDTPSLIASASRSLQMVQLIQYAFPFLSAADSIKYGDGQTKDLGILGDLLTEIVNGRSAMDSYGMKYALFEDTAPESDSYKKYIPGGGKLAVKSDAVAKSFGLAGDTKDSLCKAATSPEASAGVAAVWAAASVGTLGAAAAAAGINYAAGKGMEVILSWVLQSKVLGLIVGLIPDSVKEAAIKFLVGDLTENISGEAVGDVVASGSINLMAQTANGGGNMPQTVDQAVAYEKVTEQVELAYAEEVRATHSPLDMSSKYTFMGSIFDSMMPHFSKLSTVGGVISSISSMTSKSLGTIFNVNAAENNKSKYKMCTIPSIKDSGIAAGPFCNISYGIPPSDLNRDPDDVVNYMLENKQIEESGAAKEGSEYQEWLDNCAAGDPQYVSSCAIAGENKEAYANYAVYSVDSRVQKTMDDPEETKPDTGSSGGGDSSDVPSGDLPTGSAKELATKILASKNVQFQTTAGKAAFKHIAETGKAQQCGAPNISPLMLGMLLSASEKFKLTLGVLTDGHGCGSPNHSTGQGVDINGVRKANDSFQQQFHWLNKRDGQNARDFMKYMDSIGEPGRVNFGQIGCWGPTGVSKPSLKNGIMFSDACNHIHMDVRKR